MPSQNELQFIHHISNIDHMARCSSSYLRKRTCPVEKRNRAIFQFFVLMQCIRSKSSLTQDTQQLACRGVVRYFIFNYLIDCFFKWERKWMPYDDRKILLFILTSSVWIIIFHYLEPLVNKCNNVYSYTHKTIKLTPFQHVFQSSRDFFRKGNKTKQTTCT